MSEEDKENSGPAKVITPPPIADSCDKNDAPEGIQEFNNPVAAAAVVVEDSNNPRYKTEICRNFKEKAS